MIDIQYRKSLSRFLLFYEYRRLRAYRFLTARSKKGTLMLSINKRADANIAVTYST